MCQPGRGLVTEASVRRRMPLCALRARRLRRTQWLSLTPEGELGGLGFWGEGGPSGLGLSAPRAPVPTVPPCSTGCPASPLGVYPRIVVGDTATAVGSAKTPLPSGSPRSLVSHGVVLAPPTVVQGGGFLGPLRPVLPRQTPCVTHSSHRLGSTGPWAHPRGLRGSSVVGAGRRADCYSPRDVVQTTSVWPLRHFPVRGEGGMLCVHGRTPRHSLKPEAARHPRVRPPHAERQTTC